MMTDKQGMPISNRKASAMALIAKVNQKGELTPAMVQQIEQGGIPVTGRTLMHRFPMASGSGGGKMDLLDSNTARIVGITDFDKLKPAENGLFLITHLALATTDVIASKSPETLAVANFVRKIKANDAFLQASILTVTVVGSVQPPLVVRLGDIMISNADVKTGDHAYELPEGFYITNAQSLKFELETPSANNGIEAGKFKGIELLFQGMHSAI